MFCKLNLQIEKKIFRTLFYKFFYLFFEIQIICTLYNIIKYILLIILTLKKLPFCNTSVIIFKYLNF